MKAPAESLNSLWSGHQAEWRDEGQVISHWLWADDIDPRLLRHQVRGQWWETIASCGVTLLVTREYEHLVMAMGVNRSGPAISYLRMPHPSGLVFDRIGGRVHIASTRNPNQVYDLKPATGLLPRRSAKAEPLRNRPLVPVRSRFYPGSLYLHDLALIDGVLHANAVGQNVVIRLQENGNYERVWWPRCIDGQPRPHFEQNYIQLNSIASGKNLAGSFFSASTDKISRIRPGHRSFPVNKRGVIFSGLTREPIARGLTRPHSTRLQRGKIWVNNSGYGEFGFVERGGLASLVRLPGWTRGLCFSKNVAFVGTSRVIPRFSSYAPGLDVNQCICGVHAVDVSSGRVMGSLTWPYGNQIFSVESISSDFASGFPTLVTQKRARERDLFYRFVVKP